MTGEPASANPLSEVLRLCTVLADRVLDARIMGQPVSADQAVALAKAARLLQDCGEEWPPLLTQALHELAEKATGTEPPAEVQQSDNVDLQGLTRLFAGFRTKDRS